MALVACGPAVAAEAPVTLDVTPTLVFSNAEVVAMGGAGAAFATAAPGLILNPAAPANRRMETVAPVTGSLVALYSPVGDERDLANLGRPIDGEIRLLDLGVTGGYRDVAAGLVAVAAGYRLEERSVAVVEGHASAAVALLDGGLIVGAGPRVLAVRFTTDGAHDDYLGAGVQAGLVAPNLGDAWNVALALRSGVVARPGDGSALGVTAARLAPGLVAGAGWSNVAALSDGPGVPVRLVADVAVDGAVPDASSLEALLEGAVVPRGARPTVSPRLGAEVDVWRDRLRLRAGTYLEPARTEPAAPRPHATGGFELRLFRLQALGGRVKLNLAWQVGADYAARYFRGAWFGLNVWQEGQVGGRSTPRAPEDTSPPAAP